MAIDTTNEKFALLSFGRSTEPMNIPVSPSSLGADDSQQLLWGYPGILWGAGAVLTFVLDLNTRLRVYLADLYTLPGADLTSMTARYLRAQTGDYTARFKKLITDATAAMS